MLALASGVLTYASPALAEDLPSRGPAIEGSVFLSVADELCGRPQVIDFSSLNPRIRAAATRCQIYPDSEDTTACSILRGLELSADSSWETAFAAFNQASSDYEGSRDTWGIWIAQWLMGSALFVRGDPYGSERHLHKALEQIDALASREAVSVVVRSSNLLVEILGMPEEISQLIEQQPTSTLPKLSRLARTMTHYHLGLTLACQKRYATAETYLRASLEILQRAPGGTFDLGPMLETLGLVELVQGDFDTAVEVLRQAQEEAYSTAGFLSLQRASSLSRRLSGLYAAAGRLEEGFENNREALESRPSTPSRQALLWLERGELYARADRLLDTRRAVVAALTAIAADETPWLEEQMLFIIGMRLSELGLFEEAARYLQKAVALLERQVLGEGEQRLLEGALLFLHVAYSQLGLDALQKDSIAALEQEVEASGHRELLEISDALVATKPPVGVETLEERHLPFFEAFQQLRTELQKSEGSWENLGEQLEPAFATLTELLSVESEDYPEYFRQLAGDHGLGRVMAQLLPAFEQVQQGRFAEALDEIETFQETFLAQEQLGPLQKTGMLMALAEVQAFFPQHLHKGIATARTAITTFESLIANMQVDEAVAGLIDDEGHDLYRRAVDLFAPVDAEEAFAYAERGRAWTLRRLLGNTRRKMTDADGQLKQILEELSALERKTRQEGADTARRQDLRRLRREYEVVRLQSRFPADGEMASTNVEPPDLERLRRQVLGSDRTLVAYFPGRDQWWIWAVDSDRVEMTSIPPPDEQLLDCLIRTARSAHEPRQGALLADPRGGRRLATCTAKSNADANGALYRQLIAPIADHLRRPHLIIVPYGSLHLLPFAALRNPETSRYLIDDFTLSLAPSATFLTLDSRREQPGDAPEALIMGDSITHLEPLPGARQEAEAVASLLSGSSSAAVLGMEATESRLYAEASRIRLLHLATHGEYLPESPYFSRLLLTGDSTHDGVLEMHEVWDRLDLGAAELVVLSGCQTALGEVSRGDEIVGLSRAFLVAGSRTVIAALWRVDDPASARLMTIFYDHFIRRGAAVATALRSAQLAMLRETRFAAPYYWAAYQVTGDPDTRWRSSFPTPVYP